jgi:hypothetical protein
MAQDVVRWQVPSYRRAEFLNYFSLFGYDPDSSVLQVHLASTFGRGDLAPAGTVKRRTREHLNGRMTFTVLGRTHDPTIAWRLITPKTVVGGLNSGYLGYLFKKKDEGTKPPHEILPLDFTPSGLIYPIDWSLMFNTRGFLITMHVATDFTAERNRLIGKLGKVRKSVDPKRRWDFLSELVESDDGRKVHEGRRDRPTAFRL